MVNSLEYSTYIQYLTVESFQTVYGFKRDTCSVDELHSYPVAMPASPSNSQSLNIIIAS